MTKFEIGMMFLTGITLIGLIVIIAIGKETAVIIPIVTALVGWLLGKKDVVAKLFVGKKEK